MRYCINPWCASRANEDGADHCSACGTPLLINDRFILIRPLFDLKRHHFCDVFEVLDTKGSWINPANTVMILKVLKGYDEQNKYVSMMEKEAETLQLLKHSGIPKSDIDDFFSIHLERGPEEIFCLAMSKFEGITLEDWIEQHGRAEQPLALNWLEQIAEILNVVHKGVSERAGGFIHRDIKPSNIIVQPDNTLALIDFGGARQTTNTYYAKVAGRSRELVTQIHSLGYTAPEQIDGKAIPQSDFYSLGKTFLRILTGKEFSDIPRDKNTGKLLWQQYAKHIDKPIREFIEDLMSEAIARRPKDTQEILSFLNETLPKQLKWSRVFRSKLFRFGGLFALILTLVLGYHYGRLFLAQKSYQTGLEQVRLCAQAFSTSHSIKSDHLSPIPKFRFAL
jgi:serine/threonine protein kinase